MSGGDTLSTIISKSDIVDIAKKLGVRVGSRRGDHTSAICPFHNDKTPSLALYNAVGNPHYKCFACNAGGGIIDFVERKRQISRDDAIRWLATEVGVTLPNRRARRRDEKSFFTTWLETNANDDLLRDFSVRRHINYDLLKKAGAYGVDLGALKLSELSAGDIEELEEIGVLTRKARGVIDFVARGKQIVFDLNGGYVFRNAAESDGGIKTQRYRFSKGFKKSEFLFAGKLASERLEANGKNVGLFIVEGILDALRLHQLGFAAVALLGTSLSAKQAEKITALSTARSEKTYPLHLFLDADEAGRRASVSALNTLLTANNPSPVDVIWPDAEGDPEELFRDDTPRDANDKIARWTQPALAAFVAQFAGFEIGEAFNSLNYASPLRRVETLRYLRSLLGSHWINIRDIADPTGVYIEGADAQEGAWLVDALDRAAGLAQPASRKHQAIFGESTSKDNEQLVEDDVLLRRALRVAQSSNFRREYPFDWGGMTRMARSIKTFTLVARQLLKDPSRRPIPYAARIVPKDGGRTRLKAGPWPEDALLQQYILSELLRARSEAPDWYAEFPAVRRIRRLNKMPIMTGPDHLRPVSLIEGSTSVVSFAYQIDQEIVDGERPPSREGMFVPYRECWQQFIDHFDNFVARQPLDNGPFYAVRLDIRGFFDNLPRYAVENVLRDTLGDAAERCFAGRKFSDHVARLLDPESNEGNVSNRASVEKIADWLADQSFGFRYFEPSDGRVVGSKSTTVGVPQGPDLSAFLANMALFPLDHAVTSLISSKRQLQGDSQFLPAPTAVYGRYVDDMVIVSTSASLLSEIESLIGERLRQLGLSMNAKHERTKALSRRRVREWLVGEKGAAVLVSASGEETPSTEQSRIEDLLNVTADSSRSRILQLFFHPDLMSSQYLNDGKQRSAFVSTLRRLRGLPSLGLRYNDWAAAARWAFNSFLVRAPEGLLADMLAREFWAEWLDLYGVEIADKVFGEPDEEYQQRQAQLNLTPLTLVFDALERIIDSRLDRKNGLDPDQRDMIVKSRQRLATYVYEHDLCGKLLEVARNDPKLAAAVKRIETMLEVQSLAIRGLAATVCRNRNGPYQLQLSSASNYVTRRFAINALDTNITSYASPMAINAPNAGGGGVEAEPLLALHEAIARLLGRNANEGSDPLDVIKNVVGLQMNELDIANGAAHRGIRSAAFIISVANAFLAEAHERIDANNSVDVAQAFIEIVAGSPNSSLLLQRRMHLLKGLVKEEMSPRAVPPGVDAKAFFAKASSSATEEELSELMAFSVVAESERNTSEESEILFGVDASKTDIHHHLKTLQCSVPETHSVFEPYDAKVRPSDVTRGDAAKFASAYRDLAEKAIFNPEKAGSRPITPLHLLEPKTPESTWEAFGAFANLDIGSQAFVRVAGNSLHSIAVPANGKSLWQVGFALADALGYRAFVRSSELDRLIVPSLEPSDELSAIPFYIMQLIVPRLCGALFGRSRKELGVDGKLPPAINRLLARLEELSSSSDNALHLVRLLELGAEAKTAELIYDSPAPMQTAGVLTAMLADVGRAASRSEKIFAENLPTPRKRELTNRRIVDLWLSAASRVEGLGPEHTSEGLKSAAAGMRVLAISRLLQALTLEIWSLLQDDDRSRLEYFIPDPDDLDLPQDALLVRRNYTQKVPLIDDQLTLLIGTLAKHAANGVTSRSHLDEITPLGWLVAFATVVGQVNIDPLPSTPSSMMRPALFGARSKQIDGQLISELDTQLHCNIRSISKFLSTTAVDEAMESVHDSAWPWLGFEDVVRKAEEMVDCACDTARIIDQIYGLEAKTCESRLFQVSEADGNGSCLIARDGDRKSLMGWQIDRDSLGVTRTSDLEVREDAEGAPSFVWSETVQDEKLISLSLAYRSLASFAGVGGVADSVAHADLTSLSVALDEKTDASVELGALTYELEIEEPEVNEGGGKSQETEQEALRKEPQSQEPSRIPVTENAAIRELNDNWHKLNELRTPPVQRASLRIALLQMNVAHVGHSYFHPLCEVSGLPYSDWEKVFSDLRNGGTGKSVATARGSKFEARRRAILKEALARCKTLGVDLLVLPEYSTRPDTVRWIATELKSINSSTSVLAGTFRQPANGRKLDFATGVNREVGLGAVLPLIVPRAAVELNNSGKTEPLVLSRMKKYPSPGLSEFIRPEKETLGAVHSMFRVDDEIPEALRYVRDLICSEVFVTMAPANIFSAVPSLMELYHRLGEGGGVSYESLTEGIFKDLTAIGEDTSPSLRRKLMSPRQTIIAVPAATSRPFDHHVFGEAGAKAAGLTTVFVNMSGEGKGQSCVIGCYNTTPMEGSHVLIAQSPYHGTAPGIWTYEYSGGKPLGKNETALVVVDINPIDTVMSKPTRQLEGLPVRLVAHIPFVMPSAEASNTEKVNFESKVQLLAQEILDFQNLGAGHVNSLSFNSSQYENLKAILEKIATLDKTAEQSLRLRAAGGAVSSLQPHSFPNLPVMIDWAYVPVPDKGVDIDVPELHSSDIIGSLSSP